MMKRQNLREKIHILFALVVIYLVVLTPTSGWTSDFLSNDLTEGYSVLVTDLVNQMRANPLGFGGAIGLNVTEVEERFSRVGLSYLLDGLPELTVDTELIGAAREHFYDMIENLYFNHYDLQGRSPGERFAAQGFKSIVWGEAMAGLAFSNVIDPDTALQVMFEELARSGFSLDGEGASLLDPYVTKIGAFFSGGKMWIAGDYYNVYILIIELGRPVDGEASSIGGRVFLDKNEDGYYQVGEAIPGCSIEFDGPIWKGFSPYAPEETVSLRSSPAGNFYVDLPMGEYEYVVDCGEIGVQSGLIEVGGSEELDIKFNVDRLNSPDWVDGEANSDLP